MAKFLAFVKPEKLSLITILELMHSQGTSGVVDGMKTARVLISVGRAVEIEHKALMCKKCNIVVPSTIRPRDSNFFSNLGYRTLQERRLAAAKFVEGAEDWTAEWTQHTRSKIGGILVECLMDTAEVVRTAVDKNGKKM